MTQSFREGDSVRAQEGFTGTIGFGPYRAASTGPDRYMVQKEDGTATSVLAKDLTPHVVYAVGEEAEELAMGRKVTIVAGPFTIAAGREFYVVQRKATGFHAWASATAIRKVKPAPKPLFSVQGAVRSMAETMAAAGFARAFMFEGRTYSLDGEYEDRQGDVWKFNGRQSVTGLPLMDCALYPSFRDFTLSDVVNSYGPLSRA